MALEIERRFIVKKIDLGNILGKKITQGYLNESQNKFTTRVRHVVGEYGRELGYITTKLKMSAGISKEFEYDIPPEDAKEILSHCGSRIIEKTRYEIGLFEVDVFLGKHAGIIIAEIELPSLGHSFDMPAWLFREITSEFYLSNFQMALCPELALEIYHEFTSR